MSWFLYASCEIMDVLSHRHRCDEYISPAYENVVSQYMNKSFNGILVSSSPGTYASNEEIDI